MKITKISLTNFRSFKKTQSIAIAPVTLLFGPNSVGKSSVLMALAYLQQVLEKGHCDPQKIDALGNRLIGGFRSLVHNGDLSSSIQIKLDFELGNTVYRTDHEDYDYLADAFNAETLGLDDFGGSVESFAIELEIAWSEKHDWAFVKNYRVWVNDHYLGCISSNESIKDCRITELNLHHPLALGDLERTILSLTPEEWYAEFGVEPDSNTEPPYSNLERLLDELIAGSSEREEGEDNDWPKDYRPYWKDIGVECQWGAIPSSGEILKTNLRYSSLEPDQNHLNYLMVSSFLTSAFLEPSTLTRKFLKSYVAIGPVRIIPDFDYVPNPNPEQKDWADGRAAWDILHKNPDTDDSVRKLFKQCNEWLSAEDKLNTSYTVRNWSLYESMKGQQDHEGKEHYLAQKRHLLFEEQGKEGHPLASSQLGTGISQVLPVVVAAHQEKLELISIEQPELHLHPRFQVELGDLFLSCSKDRSFLIETHSEHLILRIRKRIRHMYDESSSSQKAGSIQQAVSITYLEPTQDGVKARKIELDEEGEFKQRWPQGFFAERREELM